MKKLMSVLIITSLCLSMTACTGKNPSKPEKQGEIKSETGQSSNMLKEKNQLFFGKITSITGNSMTVSLAKEPDEETMREYRDSGLLAYPSDDNKAVVYEEGPSDVAANVEVAVSGEDPAISDEEVYAELGIEPPTLELKYTDEVKEFTIPAGARLNNFKECVVISLEALKKGNVVEILTDKKTGNIEEIFVLE